MTDTSDSTVIRLVPGPSSFFQVPSTVRIRTRITGYQVVVHNSWGTRAIGTYPDVATAVVAVTAAVQALQLAGLDVQVARGVTQQIVDKHEAGQ